MKELTCERCKNTWIYKGANPYCTNCSRCKSTVYIKKSPHIADIWLQREDKNNMVKRSSKAMTRS